MDEGKQHGIKVRAQREARGSETIRPPGGGATGFAPSNRATATSRRSCLPPEFRLSHKLRTQVTRSVQPKSVVLHSLYQSKRARGYHTTSGSFHLLKMMLACQICQVCFSDSFLASDLAQGADAVGAKILGHHPALLQYLDLLYIQIPTAASGLFGPRAIVAVLGISLAIFTSCRHGLIPLHSGVRQHQLFHNRCLESGVSLSFRAD